MRIQTDKPQRGFSLVELLLTLVLILCLAAASVFTFTALYRSANLDEGYDRFQSLIRFAQAEAATSGRKVRLQFIPAQPATVSADDKADLRNIQVTWEADVLNAPGVFQTLTNKSWSEEMVNELVGVEKVQSAQSQVAATPPSYLAAPSPAEDAALGPIAPEFPSITFYPDGSCDSAQIILASRNPEDERRVEVRLSGILGSVSSRTVTRDTSRTDDWAEVEEDYNALFEASEPVGFTATSTETQDELSF